MNAPVLSLLRTNLRAWIGARGFWLVLAVALLPVVMTGAWVATHQSDVRALDVTMDPADPVEGQEVTFTALVRNQGDRAVGAFNATLAVGTVTGGNLLVAAENRTTLDGLAPGEEAALTLTWTATAGIRYVLLQADVDDALGEWDEFDNQEAVPLVVRHAMPDAAQAPSVPVDFAAGENATGRADLAVTSLSWAGGDEPGAPRTVEAEVTNRGPDAVENASVALRVGRSFGPSFIPAQQHAENVTLGPGETQAIRLTWTAEAGAWWAQAWVQPPGDVAEAAPDDNARAEAFTVDPVLTPAHTPPEPPERLTVKSFYLTVLTELHLRILLPLVALFYAAGVVADEREKGSLPYILTSPIPRWLLPATKFVASFAVAALATVVGLLLTYALLFGFTVEGGDAGFLTTPILASLLTLFVYGALFSLLGVLVDRPYLVGVAFVLGWEYVAPIFVPWVGNLTVSGHIANALRGWYLDQGVLWVPEGEEALRAFFVLLAAGVGLLVASAIAMRRREFPSV